MYTLIGGGRVAKHLRHWFSSLPVDFNRWERSSRTPLEASLTGSTHVLLLISDRAIVSFYEENPLLRERECIHFSGSLYHPDILGCHPLMTFAQELYDPEFYSSIPFVVDHKEKFHGVFPFLSNHATEIGESQKALYHGLCVAAGNFPSLLWKSLAQRFAALGIDPSLLGPYLGKTLDNFRRDSSGASLTGPLVRRDQPSINAHLEALRGDPLGDLYQAFIQFYREDN